MAAQARRQPGPQQVAFARFVRHAIDTSRRQRGWTLTQTAAHAGVGRSTIFRWLNGEWTDYPQLEKVRRFCRTLHAPVGEAMRALGVPSPDATPPPVPAAVQADIRVILARLSDPAVAAEEKHHIRMLLRYLAHRRIQQPD
ncbi:helix-turn-helix transcriptional regulator [Micromonospora sp. NPDC007271]|uniref:helix-turn-helix domain-containing protein n=1 Tax=Micromonospora sp. NPDC007271 TaxID=3154587 RepID=UPI0033CF5EB3